MSGLLLVGLVALWALTIRLLVQKIGNLLADRAWRKPGLAALFMVLLPLPVIDEIIGGWQFHQLCIRHNTIQLNPKTAKGRAVYLAPDPIVPVAGTWTPIYEQPWRFLDSYTNEPVLSFEKYTAEGGILIRSLKISEGNAPLLFANRCEPQGGVKYLQIFRDLKIQQINRGTSN